MDAQKILAVIFNSPKSFKSFNLKIKDQTIPRFSHAKYLGVIIDKKLNFGANTSNR